MATINGISKYITARCSNKTAIFQQKITAASRGFSTNVFYCTCEVFMKNDLSAATIFFLMAAAAIMFIAKMLFSGQIIS
ncbi:hypothetical protein, partial [Vibrio alginolyticus]|uniref:hypothetical protein n=1 Tax=Vibrio alginolyticus TaxID=663 RepID=UPI001A8D6D19